MVDFDYHLPRRDWDDNVRKQTQYFQNIPELGLLLDVLPQFLLIVNEQRQIVFANRYVADALRVASVEHIYGLKPGELLDCPRAFEEGGGCGQMEGCEACGANSVIGFCHRGDRSIQECRILQRQTGRALDFRVFGMPVHLQDEWFTVLALTDISHEKRRQNLERIFFHDLLNLATGIATYSSVLSRWPDSEHVQEAATAIRKLVFQLTDEIKAQRELAEAEADELQVSPRELKSREVIERVLAMYRQHEVAHQRELVMADDSADVSFVSDQTLLARVLGNMVKNALEACDAGGRVTVGCTPKEHAVRFWVHNGCVMPREVQFQVFQRSFSTKGNGRGLGTYSIKLLTERYLKGVAGFASSAEEGTVFFVDLPCAG